MKVIHNNNTVKVNAIHGSGSVIGVHPANKPVILGDKYTGEYVIEPDSYYDQVLDTKGKTLERNLTVKKVPYHEISNEFGNTVYIGKEVEIHGE